MARILRFNVDKANELIARLLQQIEEIEHQLNHLIDYTISWYLMLKEKYGKLFPRRTEIRASGQLMPPGWRWPMRSYT